ncbi:MmgE/PrpD family protein [Noviherbaspirillum saxi]|uniref:MmgE/PrpD family protein n=1 Tax=Noviherbaspirillum saxi TaxID=2320863 RepID=A0A3A3FRG7_9BURK|nr:MmgE/PrpD family protein [Noviherbaspirillum saxi]RJF98636.1 MmgE/PrpD family protein [Noviherbaspirillum saxi]
MTTASSTTVAATETQRLASFAAGMTFEQIPAALRDSAKEHLLDTLGVAIASSGFGFAKSALQGVLALGEGGASTAIGFGDRMSAASAALVNGVLAHGLDYDDTHIAAIYHASAPVMPAALAVGEVRGASGKQVLLSYVLGLEVGCRLALAASGDFMRGGFHPTAICGTFAAAATAGKLMGLSEQQLSWGLGMCGSQAAGVLELGTSWLKRFHGGWAAHAGVIAASMARAGFVGPDTMLEGPRGLYATHIRRVPQGEQSPTHALGAVWHASAIALKPYPCCGFLHAAVDAALELRDHFNLADVERIECPLSLELHKLIAEPREDCIRPTEPYRALFSIQYVVALALVRGRVDLAAFHDEPLDEPDVLALAARVQCVDDPLSDYPAHFPGEVIVHLKSGQILRCRKSSSLGTPEFPWLRKDIVGKFMANATRVVPEAAARELVTRVLAIEQEHSLERLMSLACRPR